MRIPCTLAAASLCAPALAQGPGFQTPGMPKSGQTDRFSNEFNPALGLVIDLLGSWVEVDAAGADDGLDLTLRALELDASAHIDPNTWGYVVVVADEEEVVLEEAAASYTGFGGHHGLKAGRFFVDFGKTMQAHEHDLAYPERAGVLREYLGPELAGTGLQYDNWFASGDASAVRLSVGVFDDLLGGDHAHGAEDLEEGAEASLPARADADELNLTARLTGFMDAGERGVFQWGLSWRAVPEFTFELESSGFEEDGNANDVFGLDLTFGTSDETALRDFTVGAEALLFTGDIGAQVDDQGTPGAGDDTLAILDDEAFGYYLWLDRGFDRVNSAGLLYSAYERPQVDLPEDREVTLYYTRHLTEFSRLRFALSYLDADSGDDETALLVQWTNFMGSHAHGVNW